MPQAIQVKYLAPTNHKGARFSVKCAARSKIYNEPVNSFNVEQNSALAASKLARSLGWDGIYYGGQLKNGEYVFLRPAEWCKFSLEE